MYCGTRAMRRFTIMAAFRLYWTSVDKPSLLSTFKNKLSPKTQLSFWVSPILIDADTAELSACKKCRTDRQTDSIPALSCRCMHTLAYLDCYISLVYLLCFCLVIVLCIYLVCLPMAIATYNLLCLSTF